MTRSPSSGRLPWSAGIAIGLLAGLVGLGSWLVGARRGSPEAEVATEDLGPGPAREEPVSTPLPGTSIDGRATPSTSRAALPPAAAPSGPAEAGPASQRLPGRVVDREGHGRQASLSVWHLDLRAGEFESLRQTETRDDGRFDLERHPAEALGASWDTSPLPDDELRVLAESAGHGTGSLELPALRDPSVEAVIVLDGPGVLRGRVVDPSGEAAAGLQLTIELAQLRQAPGETGAQLRTRVLEARLRGGGHVRRAVTTDLDGRFEARALRRAAYDVRASADAGGVLLTELPVLADGREILLVLERPHLVVRVLDEHGQPWLCPPVYPPRGFPEDWPSTAHLAVLRVGGRDAPWIALEDVNARHAGPATVFELERDAAYLVGLYGGEERWDPVRVEARAGRIDLELRLRQTVRLGFLAVTGAVNPRLLGSDVRLRLEDPLTGFAIVRVPSLEGREAPWTVEAPAGRWRMIVEGQAWYDTAGGRSLDRGAFGRFETLVDVRPGERTPVHFALTEGARLALTATGRPCVGDLTARDEGLGPDGVAVTIGDATHWHTGVRFEPPADAPSDPLRSRERLPTNLRLGTEAIAEGLPAGRWTLLGRLADGRTVRTEVVLVDGETTEARLAFE